MEDSILAGHVLDALRASSRPLLGREIAASISARTGLDIEARAVNRLLSSSELRGRAARSRDFRWELVADELDGSDMKPPEVVSAADSPVCPECGGRMVLRVARRGRNPGERFWGCERFPICRGFSPLSGAEPVGPSATGGDPDTAGGSLSDYPVTVRARPFRSGRTVAYFDYLTVPSEKLEEIRESDAARSGRQWRCEYQPSQRAVALSPDEERAASVLDKIVARGHVTLLSPFLEEALAGAGSAGVWRAAPSFDLDQFEFDSEEERQLATVWLKTWLGDDWLRWTTPQLEFGALVGTPEAEASQRRVDFLVCHPGLSRPLVIEVDGRKGDNAQATRIRDDSLLAAGCEVIRIPAAQVREGSGRQMDRLKEILLAARGALPDEAVFRSRWRRAGQIQMILSHAINVGLIDPASSVPVVVSTDAVDFGDLSHSGLQAVLSDFQELAQRVGRLYGVEFVSGGLFAQQGRRGGAGKAQRVHISFYGVAGTGLTFQVYDASIPAQIAWQPRLCTPGLPVSFSEDDCLYFLKRIFRKPSFLEGQYPAISRALSGKDAIVLLPTGAGKSIAFQLAAFLLPGVAVVVDPILSLIRDQVDVLGSYGIDRAIGISSDLTTRRARETAYERVLGGDSVFHYVAPERFQIEEFRKAVRAMRMTVPVGLIVVDEAHCVSEWGHDFRTSYLRLGDNARECCGDGTWVPPLLALTGTASRSVLKDLQRELMIQEFDAVITPQTFDRKELEYIVVRCSSDEKGEMLRALIARHLPTRLRVPPESMGELRGDDTICGLVFCPWAGGEFGVTEVAKHIRRAGLDVEVYSGKKPGRWPGSEAEWSARRRQVEREFKRNRIPVLACTKAFGMGIDKRNIRYTVHYGLPPSLEAFYQEAGRAGRDRRASFCCLLASDDHRERNDRLLAPDASVEEIQQAISGPYRTQDDDVTRMLFFQTRAFAGIDKELAMLRTVVTALVPLDTGHRCEISPERVGENGEDVRTLFEKALHRLVVLGVVRDYTVQYSGPTYDVRVAGASREEIVDSYIKYVAAYQSARAVQERAKAATIETEDFVEFVMAMGRLYLQFVYDVIEKGRRRAISEMRAAAAAKDASQFRARILRYLESTEFSERLDAIVESTDGGLTAAVTLVAEIISPRDADSIRGQVGRYLESYPDQPALLLLRALSEALAMQPDWVAVESNLEAYLQSAAANYACPTDQVASATATALGVLARRQPRLARWLQESFLARYPDRDEARRLIAEAGLEAAGATAWHLLDRLVAASKDLVRVRE